MKYIIFDCEFNSPFKIDRKTKKLMKGNVNPLCPQEIIEIGAVKTNANGEIEDTFQIFIKPELYPALHPQVKRKTKITSGDLADGVPLWAAMKKFHKWIGEENFILFSWGQDDLRELKRNCTFFHVKTNWIQRYCDIQKMCMNHLQWPSGQQIGLKKAIEIYEIDKKYPFHKALNDSIYTAKILEKILQKNR